MKETISPVKSNSHLDEIDELFANDARVTGQGVREGALADAVERFERAGASRTRCIGHAVTPSRSARSEKNANCLQV